MAGRAKRYNDENKLNYKKIFAVIVLFIVIIMFVVGIKKLVTNGISSNGKIAVTSYFSVYSDGKWGVINSNGEVVIEPQYDEMPIIPNSSQTIFICTYDVDYNEGTYKTKVVNEKNNTIISGYDNIQFIDNVDSNGEIYYADNALIVEKDGKFGLIDLKGNELLNIDYDEISVLNGVDNSLIIKKDDKVGLCDYDGNIIINVEYKEILAIGNDYKNGYIVIDNSGLYGIIAFNKTVIFENIYLDIKPIYSSDKYVVKIDEGYRIVNKSGETLLDKSFEDVKDVSDEIIVYKENGKYGITNIYLEEKVAASYDDLIIMNNSYYIAQKDGKYGVINSDNEVQIDFQYIEIKYETTAGIVIAETSDKNYDIYDSTMSRKLTVDSIEVNDEYMEVIIGGTHKYYNFKFEEKDAKSIFSTNTLFSDKQSGKYGFVDSNGKVVVKYEYDEVTEFNKYGFAGIKKDGLWGVINTKGEVILEPTYNLDKNTSIDFIGRWHKGIGAEYYTDMN